MLLQEQAEVQQRLTQHPGIVQKESDEQSSNPAVPVQERVNGLELHVGKCCSKQFGKTIVLRIEEAFERGHAVGDRRVGRRNEDGVSRSRAADPVLRFPEISGHLRTAPSRREQYAMDFAQEANREGQAIAEQPQPVFEGGDITSEIRAETDGTLFSFPA